MSRVIADLGREHANIAKLLELLESELLAIGVGKTPDYPLLRNIMRYLSNYPDRFHHPREDLMFSQLLVREPGVRPEVEDLLAEHVSIGLASQALKRLVGDPILDSVTVREQIGASGFAYIQALREHMLKEETKLFALANVIFTRSDWDIVTKGTDDIDDPLFGKMVADEYQRLYELITERTEVPV